jgi:dipeptidyl aminopeptidase/acylaminoacyl peptidase
MKTCVWIFLALPLLAEKERLPGGKVLPHESYVHAVSLADSPVEQVYIKSKDGLYVAAALRKPKGPGPFPVLVHFHGAPGGRGMEKLVTWVRGDTGGPVWERFLQEGYVVVVADYRHPTPMMASVAEAKSPTYVDDGLAVVEWLRKQPYVDPARISAYGVSLGGNLVAHLAGRTKLHAAVLGAPAVIEFLGVQGWTRDAKTVPVNEAIARKNLAALQCPVLLVVGTKDNLIAVDEPFHDLAVGMGKPVRMLIYENGYHDFVMGPQGHAGRDEPLLDATLDALERTVAFIKKPQPQ